MSASDEHHMAQALQLARRGLGLTWPNPSVGAVIVAADGEVLARGWTAPGGRPHAEAIALEHAGADLTGATIYVLAGDRWASETQQQVYLAGGSDVRVERQTSNGWESVDVDVLMVEGVGLVRIPDGATYPIRGGFGSKVARMREPASIRITFVCRGSMLLKSRVRV